MKSKIAIAALAAMLAMCLPTNATPMLDQNGTNFSSLGTNTARSDYYYAQTFTVGMSGELSAINVLVQYIPNIVFDAPDLIVGLYHLDAQGRPDLASALGSVSIPLSSLPVATSPFFSPSVVEFNFSPLHIDVAPGEQLAFNVSTGAGLCCDLYMGDGLYADGKQWRNGNPTWDDIGILAGGRNIDTWFQTYVDPSIAPVPGPIVGAGLPGLIAALGFFGWWRRWKKIA